MKKKLTLFATLKPRFYLVSDLVFIAYCNCHLALYLPNVDLLSLNRKLQEE